jgi:hypothetical protein
MVAPGVWRDEGPGAALSASTRHRVETGRLVGQMVPEVTEKLSTATRTRDGEKARLRKEKKAAGAAP